MMSMISNKKKEPDILKVQLRLYAASKRNLRSEM